MKKSRSPKVFKITSESFKCCYGILHVRWPHSVLFIAHWSWWWEAISTDGHPTRPAWSCKTACTDVKQQNTLAVAVKTFAWFKCRLCNIYVYSHVVLIKCMHMQLIPGSPFPSLQEPGYEARVGGAGTKWIIGLALLSFTIRLYAPALCLTTILSNMLLESLHLPISPQ